MTAHDLAACWDWRDRGATFCLPGGRVSWEEASYGKSDRRVRIGRLDVSRGYPRAVYRYVFPEQEVYLIEPRQGEQP